jgi:hypothetical protein
MHLPATPSIQIVPLTRGSVVLAGQDAYACTNAADILATVAQLLPADGSFPYQPAPENVVPMTPPPNGQGGPPPPPPASADAGQDAEADRNPFHQRTNLLRLCDAWARGVVSDEQFNELLDQACPDIPLEEAMLTRDSFAPGATESQVEDLVESHA